MSTITATAPATVVTAKGQEYQLYWPTELSEVERLELLALYDEVARHEGTHGYAGPITNDLGRGLVDDDAEALVNGSIHMLLARDADGLVGSLILQPYVSHARRHTIHAKRAVVARRARGTFFPLMALEAMQKCVDIGAEIATLDVAADGPVKLWKSLGFEQYGMMPDYARRNGQSLDGYFLYMRLPAKPE